MRQFETLVISGGGIKGFGMLGILHKLSIEGYDIMSIKNLVGSSIGGIIAALLCFDFSPIEMLFLFLDLLPIKSFGEDRERIMKRLKKIFKEYTFNDLYEKVGKTLIITSFNKETRKAIFYCRKTYPEKKLIDAVHETSNVPFLMNKDEIYIDGCLCSPFPLNYSKEYFGNTKTIGIYSETSNNQLLPISNPYDDMKLIIQRFYNLIIEYEALFASAEDMIIKFENTIPFEMWQIDFKLARELFIKGYDVSPPVHY
jgi:predicted acylesterase/phospholipase RssA